MKTTNETPKVEGDCSPATCSALELLAKRRKDAIARATEAERERWRIDDEWRELWHQEFCAANPELAEEISAVNALWEEWGKRKRALRDLGVKIPNGLLD